jgi:hypothetical protein
MIRRIPESSARKIEIAAQPQAVTNGHGAPNAIDVDTVDARRTRK